MKNCDLAKKESIFGDILASDKILNGLLKWFPCFLQLSLFGRERNDREYIYFKADETISLTNT